VPLKTNSHYAQWLVLPIFALLVPFPGRAATIGSPITSDGYTFINFDGPNIGSAAGTGTNVNGIANNGSAVGFAIDNAGNLTNFVRNANGTITTLNTLNFGGDNAMALGINAAGDIVGTRNGAAFFLPPGGTLQTLTTPTANAAALGIDDQGNIVGQYDTATGMPGFFLASQGGNGLITINAPSGPNIVDAQGVNDNRLVVGFYIGADGQQHGFTANLAVPESGNVAATAVADPRIPNVPGEPGATFSFPRSWE
jgi:hypothetical protein